MHFKLVLISIIMCQRFMAISVLNEDFTGSELRKILRPMPQYGICEGW
jgi:hypothetical protein